jgi:[ribosomal protein S18]-alanine N-acetyltransferase
MVLPGDGAAVETVFGPAREDDLDALVSIDRASPRPWSREAFAAELGHSPPTLFVLRSSGAAVAFAAARIHVPEMDIVNLAVRPDRRGRGLGRLLLSSLLGEAASTGVETAFLEVRAGNVEALKLYRSAGFRETQRRRNFYAEPVEDAILMRLPMSHEAGLKGPRNAC